MVRRTHLATMLVTAQAHAVAQAQALRARVPPMPPPTAASLLSCHGPSRCAAQQEATSHGTGCSRLARRRCASLQQQHVQLRCIIRDRRSGCQYLHATALTRAHVLRGEELLQKLLFTWLPREHGRGLVGAVAPRTWYAHDGTRKPVGDLIDPIAKLLARRHDLRARTELLPEMEPMTPLAQCEEGGGEPMHEEGQVRPPVRVPRVLLLVVFAAGQMAEHQLGHHQVKCHRYGHHKDEYAAAQR
mmetsp:Transcript_36181/g.105903  ORF Transcript_36181/g.105903 Transcript_36181/m.105903 type:complete len:244 (-) Transcript_36181:886-1617(-)